MIDTSKWKEFKISDVFITEKHGSILQVPTGALMSKANLVDGDTPRVTVSNYNNGITGYYADSDDKNYRTYENFISVSFLGTVFYQPKKTSLDMKVHCLKPLKHELNIYSAGYIVSIIRKAINNFAYSDQLSSAVLAKLVFALPATPEGEPDWDYMESYMKKVMQESRWGEFNISDLFSVRNSKSISDKRGLDFNDNNPYDFIGRTPINNGVQGKIIKQDFEPNNENTFSVTQIGEKLCLFRDNKWYACQNIFLLTPLYSNLIDVNFYMCCVITKTLKAVYGEDAYSSYPTQHTLSDMLIKLPITSTGTPYWQYIEDYMQRIIQESEQTLTILQDAVQ